MRVATITALPPRKGGLLRVQGSRVSRQTSKKSLTIRVDRGRVDAAFANPDPSRTLSYNPPILKGRIIR